MYPPSFRSILVWFIWLILPLQAIAQTRPYSLSCGTGELTTSQKAALFKQAADALRQKQDKGAFVGITYIPVRPHILRRANGTGGFDMGNMNEILALTNRYYLLNGLGIQFYFGGTTPDYVDSDALYAQFPRAEGSAVDSHDAPDAMNQYYVNEMEGGYSGYAYFPGDYLQSTRSFITTHGSSAPDYHIDYLGNYVVPHELGHNFSLFHTFGFSNGENTTNELVTRGSGANCTTAGDLICDTPADPYGIAGANFYYVNDCLVYDPTSTARDANGDIYSPETSNIMSYYFTCAHDFTPGQYDHLQSGLALRQSHTSYTLSYPPTLVTAPANLTAAYAGGLTVQLTWQDRADNEMGYFIERSTSATTGFVQIAGVGPNTTTFTDKNLPARTTYYYRIRPSNTTTGSLSPTTAAAPPPTVSGLTTTAITGTSAQLNWTSLGDGFTYTVQWRPTGSNAWNTITGVTATTITITGLYVNTGYEWRVGAFDPPDYADPVRFTTPCAAPLYPVSTTVTRTSALLFWDSNANHYQSYAIRARVAGSPDWTISGPVGSSSYALNGLTSATRYEWQVQGVCSASAVSDFSSTQPFTTLACLTPYLLSISSVGASLATLYWSDTQYEQTKTYDLRYRVAGTTDWQTSNGLTSTYVSLTGLAHNTTYEWQVRGHCSDVESSAYSDVKTFATKCVAPSIYSTTTPTTASLSWYGNYEQSAVYTLQYRLTGTADWTTVGNLTTYTYTLTGLTPNATYEFHVQTLCSATDPSDYSPISTFTTFCSTPYGASARLLTSTSAQLNWSVQSADANTRFSVQYRVAGTANWTTISSGMATSYNNYSLTGLTNNTTYEWQVSTVCSPTERSDFVVGASFTTQCRVPSYGSATVNLSTTTLTWEQTGIDVQYDVQVRATGSPNWIVLANLTSPSLSLTGLAPTTTYEWQVRTRCSDGVYADFSVMYQFTTGTCPAPSSMYTAAVTPSSATIRWTEYNTDANTRFDARYRVAGAADWTTIPDLTVNRFSGLGAYTFTGLAVATAYEWQIQTVCSSANRSPFSASSTFQTTSCQGMYTVKAGSWDDPTVWSCNRIPTPADAVQIRHTVTIAPSYVASAQAVRYDAGQKLSFGTNASLKLGF